MPSAVLGTGGKQNCMTSGGGHDLWQSLEWCCVIWVSTAGSTQRSTELRDCVWDPLTMRSTKGMGEDDRIWGADTAGDRE